jgi:hypothetical protein
MTSRTVFEVKFPPSSKGEGEEGQEEKEFLHQ